MATPPSSRRWQAWLLGIPATLLTLALLAVAAGQAGAFAGSRPSDLGAVGGLLRPPSHTPNSVSSQANRHPDHPQRERAQIAPLRYEGSGQAAMQRLAAVLARQDRTVVVRNEPGYLHAESQTALMRFTDDLEFLLAETEGVIHLRSASRIGYGDRGVNRARIEVIRRAFDTSVEPKAGARPRPATP